MKTYKINREDMVHISVARDILLCLSEVYENSNDSEQKEVVDFIKDSANELGKIIIRCCLAEL